jgi:hypothetical protein
MAFDSFCMMSSYKHKIQIVINRGKRILLILIKAQDSFSDHLLSSVCLSVKFYIFDFSRITAPILTRLGTNHPWGGFKFLQMKGNALLEGEIIAKELKYTEI